MLLPKPHRQHQRRSDVDSERGDDIVALASAFAVRFAQRIGRSIEPLTEECKRRLKAYGWPGNVRELQNVIERAVIISRDGRLNLKRALPAVAGNGEGEAPSARTAQAPKRVLSVRELQQLERENIVCALESCGWRVAGKDEAAQLLGIDPSTLNSRIRALKIQRAR